MNDETLWEVFQTVYEPGSRDSFERAERDLPDVLDGVRVVAEWARKEALREAADAVQAQFVERLSIDYYARAENYGVSRSLKAVRALSEGATS